MQGDFRLGDWLVRPQLNRIESSRGKATTVEPKAMEVLVYLAENSKEVLPKERIIQAVWPDTFVTDDVLSHAISELRKAMGDDARNSRVILTVPKRGYRLLPTVGREAPIEKTLVQASIWKRVLPWAFACLFAVAFLVSLFIPSDVRTNPPPPVFLNAELSPGIRLWVDSGTGPAAVLSPDGSMLAFVGGPEEGGDPRIYVRRLDELEATPLAGTEGVRHPVFSPDGQWIAFRANFQLKKISVNGGIPIPLCETGYTRGLAWLEDGSIIFSDGSSRALTRVSSDGAKVDLILKEEQTPLWPQVLPGGNTVLFTSGPATPEGPSIVAQQIGGEERRVLWQGGHFARYLPSGHLVYMNQGTLFAVGFDPKTLAMKGQPVPVLENVSTNLGNGRAEFAFSEEGTAVYVPDIPQEESTLIWIDRDGKQDPIRSEPDRYSAFRISPDNSRLAWVRDDEEQADIWIHDLERDLRSRFTFNLANDRDPVWSPDGGAIIFTSNRSGPFNLYWKRTDGSGETISLAEHTKDLWPISWHPSGRYVSFSMFPPESKGDIWILTLTGDSRLGWKAGEMSCFLSTPFDEHEAVFSPDGHWLAYQSNESGTMEVYVRPFPGPGGKWQVSNGGGGSPIWSPQGKELLYMHTGQIYSLRYRLAGDAFVPERPTVWAEGIQDLYERDPRGGIRGYYDIAQDGHRIALRVSAAREMGPNPDHIVFIENFFDELTSKAPVDR